MAGCMAAQLDDYGTDCDRIVFSRNRRVLASARFVASQWRSLVSFGADVVCRFDIVCVSTQLRCRNLDADRRARLCSVGCMAVS